jgi:cytochrome c-type biogenesis protein CcmF
MSFPQQDTLTAENLIVQLQKVDGKKVQLGLKESEAIMQYVTLKAYKFPFINLVWLGTILTVIGILISMFHRRYQSRTATRTLKVVRREEREKSIEV